MTLSYCDNQGDTFTLRKACIYLVHMRWCRKRIYRNDVPRLSAGQQVPSGRVNTACNAGRANNQHSNIYAMVTSLFFTIFWCALISACCDSLGGCNLTLLSSLFVCHLVRSGQPCQPVHVRHLRDETNQKRPMRLVRFETQLRALKKKLRLCDVSEKINCFGPSFNISIYSLVCYESCFDATSQTFQRACPKKTPPEDR